MSRQALWSLAAGFLLVGLFAVLVSLGVLPALFNEFARPFLPSR